MEDINTLTLEAKVDFIPTITAFVDTLLEEHDCSMKSQINIDVAIDEIFSNIAYYAYPDTKGNATVNVRFFDNKVELTFIDSGIPYNPLEKEDPDVSAALEDREIGGLGIFMVKKTMDEMSYEYKDGKNILKLVKTI